jgi:hypothetical protein
MFLRLEDHPMSKMRAGRAKATANTRFGSKRFGVIFEKPIGRSWRETLYFKALEIFGWRFRLPGLRSLRNPFSLTLDMLLNRLLGREPCFYMNYG